MPGSIISPGIAPVGVVLVAGKAGPAARPDGEKLGHQQAADAVVVLGAKDVLDLAVGLGVVRPILHLSISRRADGEGLQHLIELRAGDEDFGICPTGR
jgi:hypothetical protein